MPIGKTDLIAGVITDIIHTTYVLSDQPAHLWVS